MPSVELPASPADLRVLVVDDSAPLLVQVRHLVRYFLPGAQVHEALDLREGRSLVARAQPHLVFLDLVLPNGMSGAQLLPDLAALPHRPRVLLMTGLPRDAPQVDTAFARGANAHLSKPLRTRDVRLALEALGFTVAQAPVGADARSPRVLGGEPAAARLGARTGGPPPLAERSAGFAAAGHDED